MGTSNKGWTGATFVLRVPQKHMDCQVLNLICNVPRSEQRDPVNVKMWVTILEPDSSKSNGDRTSATHPCVSAQVALPTSQPCVRARRMVELRSFAALDLKHVSAGNFATSSDLVNRISKPTLNKFWQLQILHYYFYFTLPFVLFLKTANRSLFFHTLWSAPISFLLSIALSYKNLRFFYSTENMRLKFGLVKKGNLQRKKLNKMVFDLTTPFFLLISHRSFTLDFRVFFWYNHKTSFPQRVFFANHQRIMISFARS